MKLYFAFEANILHGECEENNSNLFEMIKTDGFDYNLNIDSCLFDDVLIRSSNYKPGFIVPGEVYYLITFEENIENIFVQYLADIEDLEELPWATNKGIKLAKEFCNVVQNYLKKYGGYIHKDIENLERVSIKDIIKDDIDTNNIYLDDYFAINKIILPEQILSVDIYLLNEDEELKIIHNVFKK